MHDPCTLVLDFLANWKAPGGFQKAVSSYFNAETVYENVGMSKTRGIAEACLFFESFAGPLGCNALNVRTLSIAAQGNIVLTERIDDVLDAGGKVLFSLRLMGVFEVRNGRIVSWRDYFDTGSMPKYEGPGAIA